jgi:hypothetical protein
MSDPKHDEKEEEKHDEKLDRDEKNWDEKWRRDPVNAAAWAAIFIWAGLVLLADNLRLFTRFEQLDAWAIILIGAGLMVLVEVVVRLAVPAYRRPVAGSIIFGIILLAVGTGNIIGWDLIWPVVLIGLGVLILARGLFRSR